MNENNDNNKSSIKVIPNPSDGHLELEMQIPKSGEYNILIYNSIGKLMDEFDYHFLVSGTETITLNTLVNAPDGLYFVVVKGENNIQSARIIKQ